jgi:hypothetical protein
VQTGQTSPVTALTSRPAPGTTQGPPPRVEITCQAEPSTRLLLLGAAGAGTITRKVFSRDQEPFGSEPKVRSQHILPRAGFHPRVGFYQVVRRAPVQAIVKAALTVRQKIEWAHGAAIRMPNDGIRYDLLLTS